MTYFMTTGEFAQRLGNALDRLTGLTFRVSAEDEAVRLYEKRDAVEEALALWIAVVARGSEDTLEYDLADYRERINTLAEFSKDGAREGFNLVRSYLEEVELVE